MVSYSLSDYRQTGDDPDTNWSLIIEVLVFGRKMLNNRLVACMGQV